MTRYRRTLLDASALVAIFQPNEQHHPICTETLRLIAPPLFSTWPVVTEAHYLLRSDRSAQQRLLELLQSDAVSLQGLGNKFLQWCDAFARRYGDHDIQIADASLMWLAETLNAEMIFTLDRRDFSIFRTSDGRALQIIPQAD